MTSLTEFFAEGADPPTAPEPKKRRRTNKSARDAGGWTERATADYLAKTLGDDRIDRRVKRGAKDRGDISGVRVHGGQRLVIECKDVRHESCTKCKRVTGLSLPAWTSEAHTEAGNDDALAGVVVVKRTGTKDPGRFWVVMTVDDLAALIDGARHGHRDADQDTDDATEVTP